MENPDVVLSIHRHAYSHANDPMVRQRLRPQWVHFKHGSLDVGGLHCGPPLQQRRRDSQQEEDTEKPRTHIATAYHTSHPPALSCE